MLRPMPKAGHATTTLHLKRQRQRGCGRGPIPKVGMIIISPHDVHIRVTGGHSRSNAALNLNVIRCLTTMRDVPMDMKQRFTLAAIREGASGKPDHV